MKKLLPVLIICSILFLALPGSYSSLKASSCAAAGPCGINGLKAVSGPTRGQVTLDWSRVTLTGENYSIRYGTQPGVYPFTASHVGYIATFTVGNLVPGQTYYFVLERIQIGDVSLGWDGEVSARAATGISSPVVTSGPVGRNSLVVKAIGSGKVTMTWNEYFTDTSVWHIVYSETPGQWRYGVLNAVSTVPGKTMGYSFTVGALKRGVRYYFAIVPVKFDGTARYITSEVSTVAR